MNKFILFFLLVFICGCKEKSYEDCILENMKGVGSNLAAANIRHSCEIKYKKEEIKPAPPSESAPPAEAAPPAEVEPPENTSAIDIDQELVNIDAKNAPEPKLSQTNQN